LGPMTETEVVQFIESLGALPGLGNAAELSKAEAIRVADACDRLPLAIRWSLSRARTASEALAVADNITKSRKTGDELLEFCFRRVFESMPTEEKGIVEVLSLFQRPLPTEALVVGTGHTHYRVLDAIEQLTKDALVQRLFDPE